MNVKMEVIPADAVRALLAKAFYVIVPEGATVVALPAKRPEAANADDAYENARAGCDPLTGEGMFPPELGESRWDAVKASLDPSVDPKLAEIMARCGSPIGPEWLAGKTVESWLAEQIAARKGGAGPSGR